MNGRPLNFALIGAAGFVAPRHIKAIYETGNRLVAATDPHDSVGVLDRYFPEVQYFPEIERFDRHLEMLRYENGRDRVDWVSICTPNYLHDAHARLALRADADAICEKPLVLTPWNIDQLARIENDTGKRVYTVLQLRLIPELVELKGRLDKDSNGKRHTVDLVYITPRGPWYHRSWKGSIERSGGLVTNIGIHFFDLLLWLFGPAKGYKLQTKQDDRVAGVLELAKADVSWLLSVDRGNLPETADSSMLRRLTLDGVPLEFSPAFQSLHTDVYRATLAGQGFGIEDARPSIELVHSIRNASVTTTRRKLGDGNEILKYSIEKEAEIAKLRSELEQAKQGKQ